MAERGAPLRKLYLLRHGKSSWDDPALDDFERPLTGRGRKAARRMAAHFAATGIRPALVLVSAARRTRATYDAMGAALVGVPMAIEDGLYEAGKSELMERLRALDEHLGSVMLIGHNPGLERLTQALIHGHGDEHAVARLKEKFPTGALAVLEADVDRWAKLAGGTCRLVDFVRPKDLGDPEGEE